MEILSHPKKLKHLFKKVGARAFLDFKVLVMVLLIGVMVSGFPAQIRDYNSIILKRHNVPYRFPGNEYRELPRFLEGTNKIGYYTDRDLAHDKAAGTRLALAQLMVTPTIIDPDSDRHDFILIDCASPYKAVAKIKELNLKPIFLNPQAGIILAHRES